MLCKHRLSTNQRAQLHTTTRACTVHPPCFPTHLDPTSSTARHQLGTHRKRPENIIRPDAQHKRTPARSPADASRATHACDGMRRPTRLQIVGPPDERARERVHTLRGMCTHIPHTVAAFCDARTHGGRVRARVSPFCDARRARRACRRRRQGRELHAFVPARGRRRGYRDVCVW